MRQPREGSSVETKDPKIKLIEIHDPDRRVTEVDLI